MPVSRYPGIEDILAADFNQAEAEYIAALDDLTRIRAKVARARACVLAAARRLVDYPEH